MLQSWSCMYPFTTLSQLLVFLESSLKSSVARKSPFPEPWPFFFQCSNYSHSSCIRAFANFSSLLPKLVLPWKQEQTQQRWLTHCPSHFPEFPPAIQEPVPSTAVSVSRAVVIMVSSLARGTVPGMENAHRKGFFICMRECMSDNGSIFLKFSADTGFQIDWSETENGKRHM